MLLKVQCLAQFSCQAVYIVHICINLCVYIYQYLSHFYFIPYTLVYAGDTQTLKNFQFSSE